MTDMQNEIFNQFMNGVSYDDILKQLNNAKRDAEKAKAEIEEQKKKAQVKEEEIEYMREILAEDIINYLMTLELDPKLEEDNEYYDECVEEVSEALLNYEKTLKKVKAAANNLKTKSEDIKSIDDLYKIFFS